MPGVIESDQKPSPFRILPDELKVEVIEYLWLDAQPIIRFIGPICNGFSRLAVVCKEWQPFVEERIFKRVTITRTNLGGLRTALTPHRKACIREIYLNFGQTKPWYENTFPPGDDVEAAVLEVSKMVRASGNFDTVSEPWSEMIGREFSRYMRQSFELFTELDSLTRGHVTLTLGFGTYATLNDVMMLGLLAYKIKLDPKTLQDGLPKLRGISDLIVGRYLGGERYDPRTVTCVANALPDLTKVDLAFMELPDSEDVYERQRESKYSSSKGTTEPQFTCELTYRVSSSGSGCAVVAKHHHDVLVYASVRPFNCRPPNHLSRKCLPSRRGE